MTDLFRQVVKLSAVLVAFGIYGYVLLIATAVAFGFNGHPIRVLLAAGIFAGGLLLPFKLVNKYRSLQLR
jgi:hypothetical protein